MHGHASPTFGRSNADRSRGIDTHMPQMTALPLPARRLDRDTCPQCEDRTSERNQHRRSERRTHIRFLQSTHPLHRWYCSKPSMRYKPGHAAALPAPPHCKPLRCTERDNCGRYCRPHRRLPSSAAFLNRSATYASVASTGGDSWSTSAPSRRVRCSGQKAAAQTCLVAIWKHRPSGQTLEYTSACVP